VKVDVIFSRDNQLTVRAYSDNGLRIIDATGQTEELTEEIRDTIARLEDQLAALYVALARILYSPSFI
jgi:hypothetical protein